MHCDFCRTRIRYDDCYHEWDGDVYCKDCLLDTTRLKEVPLGAVCECCGSELEGYEAYQLGDFIYCEECLLDFTRCCD